MPTFPHDDLVGFGYTYAPIYSTTITRLRSGHEQRNQNWTNPLRRWRLSVLAMEDAERAVLDAFIDSVAGSFGTFDWICPVESVTYTVRFQDDVNEIATEHVDGHYSDLILVEVRA